MSGMSSSAANDMAGILASWSEDTPAVAGPNEAPGTATSIAGRSAVPAATSSKTAAQIAAELIARSWTLEDPVEVRNELRRIARILRFGSDRLDMGRKAGGGEIRETTVTGVRESGGVRYYDTAEGVLLTDADLR
jgi:hypothetical protein